MKVALAARTPDKLAVLAKETGAKLYGCDATKRDQVEKLFTDLDAAEATPDVVVYNASYRTRGPLSSSIHPRLRNRSRFRPLRDSWWLRLRPSECCREAWRDFIYRRFCKHQRLCAVGAIRHGQVRVAWAGPKHGARIVAARNSHCSFCNRWRHPQRASSRAARSAGFLLDPDAIAQSYLMCSISRAARGRGKSSCGRGWKNSSRRLTRQHSHDNVPIHEGLFGTCAQDAFVVEESAAKHQCGADKNTENKPHEQASRQLFQHFEP